MSTVILLPDATLRQAVARFHALYPDHAKTYAAQLTTARRIVHAGGVIRDDDIPNTFFVGTLSKKNALLVRDRKCACGNQVCCHRLAVYIASIGQSIVSEQVITASEHAAIMREEQEPHDDRHAEHGQWNTHRQHICGDRTVTNVPCTEIGQPIVCPHCGQAYCLACDSEVAP